MKPYYHSGLVDPKLIPPARRDLIDYYLPLAAIEATRGCPVNCDFCFVHKVKGKIHRKRPIENVIDEIKSIKQKNIFFFDASLTTDPIYTKLRDNQDKQYFLNKITNAKGPILEMGVGTGRLFISALKNGSDIYGIDISRNMIEMVKKKLAIEHHYRISNEDARILKMDKKFALILAPFRVFSHIIEIEDQLKVLNNVAHHLAENGRFIFDVFIPNHKMIACGRAAPHYTISRLVWILIAVWTGCRQ